MKISPHAQRNVVGDNIGRVLFDFLLRKGGGVRIAQNIVTDISKAVAAHEMLVGFVIVQIIVHLIANPFTRGGDVITQSLLYNLLVDVFYL